MKCFCAICNKFMGDIAIEGKLRKGYAALSVYIECEDCHEPEETSPRESPKAPCPICKGSGFKDGKLCVCVSGEGIDWLLGAFGMTGGKK